MDFSQIFELQKDLDQKINQKVFSMNPELEQSKHHLQSLIGLTVEVSELANEIQFFKYWKKNKNINWDKVYEEYTDLIHFLVSNANFYKINPIIEAKIVSDDLTYQFKEIFIQISKLIANPNKETLRELFELIVGVAQLIDLDYDKMFTWYLKVNQKNYNRIKNDY